MVVNNEGKIFSLNQRFISIWKLPQHVVEARCEWQLFQFIAEELENPQSFLIDIRNVRSQRSLEIQELVELKDGRFFSHISIPQWFEKTVVGRIYQFQIFNNYSVYL
jgi:PAS domain-containing protein